MTEQEGYIFMSNKVSFSFAEITKQKKNNLDKPSFLISSDSKKLAYYTFKAKRPIASLIFIHGGGAYSGAGYQFLAKGPSQKYNVSVYLFDIRGHGNSEGRRGDSPSVNQVYKDLKLFTEFVTNENKKIPVYLGGHSSGCGLILNYLNWNKKTNFKGYIFISPEFGYKSNTKRDNIEKPFAKVIIPLFVLNGIFQGKLFGNIPAVFFNYPDEILKSEPLLIKSITCNMSNSLTPQNPQKQFSKLNKPFGLFIGGKDELFDSKKIIQYAEFTKNEIKAKSVIKIVEKENHLSILKVADKLIGETIFKINRNR